MFLLKSCAIHHANGTFTDDFRLLFEQCGESDRGEMVCLRLVFTVVSLENTAFSLWIAASEVSPFHNSAKIHTRPRASLLIKKRRRFDHPPLGRKEEIESRSKSIYRCPCHLWSGWAHDTAPTTLGGRAVLRLALYYLNCKSKCNPFEAN